MYYIPLKKSVREIPRKSQILDKVVMEILSFAPYILKNDDAKWFVATHQKSLEKMEQIKAYLQGPKTKNDNW